MGAENLWEHLRQGAVQFAGWMALFPATCGKLLLVNGIKAARSIKGVQDVFIARKPGHVIKQATDNSAVCGFIWAVAANRDELFKNSISARSAIRFVTQ